MRERLHSNRIETERPDGHGKRGDEFDVEVEDDLLLLSGHRTMAYAGASLDDSSSSGSGISFHRAALPELVRFLRAVKAELGDNVTEEFADGNGKEAPRIELLKEIAEFLYELHGREILLHAPLADEEEDEAINAPFEFSGDRAEQLSTDLMMLIDRERRGIHEDHPLVKCASCGQQATHCEMGNSYCPSCGESLDGAPEVPDTRDILDVLAERADVPVRVMCDHGGLHLTPEDADECTGGCRQEEKDGS